MTGQGLEAGFSRIDSQRDTWVAGALAQVETILQENTPNDGDPQIRQRALYLLDDPLHLNEAPSIMAVGEFFIRAIDRALLQIETGEVTSGAVVWKLYNHSFVVKTAEGVYGFDISRGVDKVRITDTQMERLVHALDCLFISHLHRDHTDYGMAEQMMAQGKPIIAPPDLWLDKPVGDRLVRPERDPKPEGRIGNLSYRVFPGHQGGDVTNNVYLVSSGGVSVMQTGDQSNDTDFAAWIDSLGQFHRVDILLANCWTNDLPRLARGINPRVLITGHENELGHTVDHRESFSKTYGHLKQVRCPAVVMSWGERWRLEN